MKSILIIGIGSIGERHLRCFKATARCEVSGCEPNESLRLKMGERYGCPVYASVEEAMGAGTWDGAVICTPAHTHIPIAMHLLDQGMHLLIEKPLSTTLAGIDDLIQKATERKAIVRVAYVFRSIPVIAAIREALQTPGLEDIRHIVVTSGQNFAKARPAYASTYFARRETGGGCIQDALTHQVHAVEWVVGPIERVYCDASHEVLAGVEVEDTVNLTARLHGGIAAVFAINQFQAPNDLVLSFHAAGGSVRVEFYQNRLGLLLAGDSDWAWREFPLEERDAMFVRQANSFLDALDGQADNLSTLEASLQTLRVNLAALQSSTLRQEVIL